MLKSGDARNHHFEGDGVKRELPPYWTAQLAAIILVFSVGAALFPAGLVANFYWVSSIHYQEPDYTYHGSFEANLTAATPIANVSIGYCDTIEVSDRRWEAAVPITLRMYNDTHYLFAVFLSFGGETTWWPASAELHFATAQNYTVQVEREAQDTFFRCYISAYEKKPLLVLWVPTFPILYYGAGTFLMLFGLLLTSNFIRRTRTFYWTT